jgi:hypothetical protein
MDEIVLEPIGEAGGTRFLECVEVMVGRDEVREADRHAALRW